MFFIAARGSSDPLVRIDIRVELPPSLVAGTEGDTNLEKIEIPPDHEPPPSSVAGTEGDTDWERQPSEEQEQHEEQEEAAFGRPVRARHPIARRRHRGASSDRRLFGEA